MTQRQPVGNPPRPPLASNHLAKTQAVAVAVLDLEIAAAVGLVEGVTHNLGALRLELSVERVGIADPDVCIPGASFGIDDVIWPHPAGRFELRPHAHGALPFDHAE